MGGIMADEKRIKELVLVEEEDRGERRVVSLIEGGSLALVECSSGPVTSAAYGSRYHGHKMLFSVEACAHALGVTASEARDALVSLFTGARQKPSLSDIMDCFDVSEQAYQYMAWSGAGDIVFRPGTAA